MEGEIVNRGVQPSKRQILKDIDQIEEAVEQRHQNAVAQSAKEVLRTYRIVRFKQRIMIERPLPYPHFTPLHKQQFDDIAYPILGGVSRSRMNDVYAYLCSTAEDMTENEHLIGFGIPLAQLPIEADTDVAFHAANRAAVWDSRGLRWERGAEIDDCVWRSPHVPVEASVPIPFVMQLAGGDKGVYDDIMQSMAPLVMEKKPDGVIWWVGDGANGKSTLMDALFHIFPGALASINLKRLVDGRDSPSLNGTLGNIVKESSEARIEDTEVYKSLGTHENFRVHKFHSQDDIGINGNIHTIFSGNTIPVFNDKGFSARRRTFVIPFTQRFESDPDFERKTFTPEFFGQLVSELCRYAQILRQQGYRYKWSGVTRTAKMEYDTEANCAEEYAKTIIEEGVVAFLSYQPVRMDYENWCAENGYVPLGIHNLRKALTAVGFDRTSKRDSNGHVSNLYRLGDIDGSIGLEKLSLTRPGLFALDSFRPGPAKTPERAKTPEPAGQTTILGGKW